MTDRMDAIDFLGTDPLKTADALGQLAADLRNLAAGVLPNREHIIEAPLIHRWSIVQRPTFALSGSLYNHPRIKDGQRAVTSELFAICRDRQWARTMNRFYDLGPTSLEGLQ